MLLCRSSRDSWEDREFYQAKTVKTHSNNLVMLTHVQLKPFYRLSTRDVTHVRKCTRPSPAFPYYKQRKGGRGPGNEATLATGFYSRSMHASTETTSLFWHISMRICQPKATNGFDLMMVDLASFPDSHLTPNGFCFLSGARGEPGNKAILRPSWQREPVPNSSLASY